MTMFAGVIQSALSPILHRIRPLLPPEIGGLVVFLVGTSIAAIGCRYMIGGAAEEVGHDYWLVGGVTLMTTVGLNVWGRGQAKLFCAMSDHGRLWRGASPGCCRKTRKGAQRTALFAIPHFSHGGWRSRRT